MAQKNSTPARRKTSETAAKAAGAGIKAPRDYMKEVRGIVPDFVYSTTFGDVSLPGYLPFGLAMDNAGLSEQEIFQRMILAELDEEGQRVVNALPLDTFEGIEGSFMGLMREWFGAQGVDIAGLEQSAQSSENTETR